MMMRTTTPSRQPIVSVIRIDDRNRRQGEMEEELVRLFVRRFAVVSRDRDIESGGDDPSLHSVEPAHHVGGDIDRVRALALGDREADGGTALKSARRVAGHRPRAMLDFGRADNDIGDVLDVYRTSVAGGQQQQPDVGHALQGLPRHHRQGAALPAKRARQKRTIGVGELVRDLRKRDAVERELFGVRLDADLAWAAADDERGPDALDLGQFVLKLLGNLVEPIVRPAARLVGLSRQCQDNDRDIVDSPPDDERLGDALGDLIDRGADLFVDPQHRRILVRADEKARGDDDAIVLGLRIDVLDAQRGPARPVRASGPPSASGSDAS